jgi:hypothetical protein
MAPLVMLLQNPSPSYYTQEAEITHGMKNVAFKKGRKLGLEEEACRATVSAVTVLGRCHDILRLRHRIARPVPAWCS